MHTYLQTSRFLRSKTKFFLSYQIKPAIYFSLASCYLRFLWGGITGGGPATFEAKYLACIDLLLLEQQNITSRRFMLGACCTPQSEM